jgi:hypothetical protein
LLSAVVLSWVTLSVGERVHATTITVNTATDPSPGADGRWPDDGVCSLRAALANALANNNTADPDCQPGAAVPGVLDVIQIAPSLAGRTLILADVTAAGPQGLPTVSGPDNPVQIIGPTRAAADFVISGGNGVRPFVLGYASAHEAAGDLRLANLTVADGNGRANNPAVPAPDGMGGAFYLGEASRLTLDNVVVRDNTVDAPSARGGAVYAVNSAIVNNGGAYVDNTVTGLGTVEGGAVFLELSSDRADAGGSFDGYAMLMQGNTASATGGRPARGGAIAVNASYATSKVHIDRSLFRDNTAGFSGVLSATSGIRGGSGFDVTDSTFTGNSGVIAGSGGNGSFTFVNDTFVDTGRLNQNIWGDVHNSIITGGTTCDPSPFTGSHNLISPVTGTDNCVTLDPTVPGTYRRGYIGVPTGVAGDLAQNGGPDVQQTFALSPTSG